MLDITKDLMPKEELVWYGFSFATGCRVYVSFYLDLLMERTSMEHLRMLSVTIKCS